MNNMAFYFVIIPLIIYLPMFLYETYIAFRRIGKPLDKGGQYLHATWESTHTFLVASVNYFVWLYSSAVVTVGKAIFIPLLIFGAAFIVRAILYVYLFYIKSSEQPNLFADYSFAWLHIIMAFCLECIAVSTLVIMFRYNFQPNYILLPLLWPGLILMIPLLSVPLYFLYRTKSS